MSDENDNQLLNYCSLNADFQERVYRRFVNACVSVTNEDPATASHVQRLAFAGSIFNRSPNAQMLCELVLVNTTNRANAVASQTPGANILDSDIDFQIASVLTGVALSRAWT